MKCPVCDAEMRLTQREEIEIDYCPQCRGVWLDRGELEKIIARVEGIVARGRSDDDDDDDDDDRDDRYDRGDRGGRRGDDRDDSPRRDYEAGRREYDSGRSEERYRREEPRYPDSDSSRYGKPKREGFLGNLFDMFGGD